MEKPQLAIFDIDGTLLPGTSCERLFFRYLLKEKILGPGNLLNFAIRGITLAPRGRAYIISANKGYLGGFTTGFMEKIGMDFFQDEIADRIPKRGIIELLEHRMRGHSVILLSGMPEFLLANFSVLLKVAEYHGSVMETDNDKFTGRTLGTFPLGRGKVDIVEKVLKNHGLQWDEVTAYADHYNDRFLLQKVGKPVVVNPERRLKNIAERNDWRIEYFDNRVN